MHNDDQVFDAALKRRWVAAALALTLVCGLGVSTPLTAQAAPGDIVIKLPDTTASPTIVAASGSSQLLRESYDEATETYSHSLSSDAGASWKTASLNGPVYIDSSHVADGVLTYQGADRRVRRFDLGTNTSTDLRELDREVAAMGPTEAVLWERADDDRPTGLMATTLAGDQAPRRLNNYTLRSLTRTDVAMVHDAAVVASINKAGDKALLADGYLDRVPLDGTTAVSSVKIPGLSTMAARGDQAVYVTGTTSGANLCFRSATQTGGWESASCTTLKKGDQRRVRPTLMVGNGWAVVRLSHDSGEDQLIVRGTTTPATPSPITLPKGINHLDVYGTGDSDAPLANVVTSKEGYLAYYRSDGSLARIVGYEAAPNWPDDYELTPNAILGTDPRPSLDSRDLLAWSRSVANGVAGTEQILPVRASYRGLSASGDRTIINGTSGVHLLDRGKIARKLSPTRDVSKLTGSYYLAEVAGQYDEMLSIDGAHMLSGPVIDIFGSLALKKVKKNTYEVIDVTGNSKPIKVTTTVRQAAIAMWGDWIAVDDWDSDEIIVFNYRKPSQSYRQNGTFVALGDGFALLSRDDAQNHLVVWDLAKNSTRIVASASRHGFGRSTTDGSHRILFRTEDDDLMIRELSEGGRSKPRLLGLIAPTTLNNLSSTAAWKPEIDATKALGKGTLTIKNSKGKTVHTLAVKAAPNGSIRDITWNGRTKDGARVPAGTYTWELTTPATDGTGNLVRVDGTSALNNAIGISGTIKVTSKSLGTVKGATPKISDTTPVVGQTLTVKPGTWKPAGATLSYTWYRDKKAISGAARTTYTVATGDVGKKLTVKVTGTMDGWKTTTKTSKATGKVKRK